ncbi:MAG: type II toxin-antitoxin system PemK/MazF family toxin [bacterium]
MAQPEARRGDIVLVAGGVYASKPRPAVILQDDLFDGTDSVTVCPFTTSDVDAPLLRMAIPASDATGIDSPSFAMIDKVTTVRRSSAGPAIGRLDSVQMLELERRLLVFLGLAH